MVVPFYARNGWPGLWVAELKPISPYLKRQGWVVSAGGWWPGEPRPSTAGEIPLAHRHQSFGTTICSTQMVHRSTGARSRYGNNSRLGDRASMIALAPNQAAPSLTKQIPSIGGPTIFLLYAHPLLLQHVFAEIYDLLERVAILAEFNGHAKRFSNKGSVRVINNRLRERSIIQCVRAVPRRK